MHWIFFVSPSTSLTPVLHHYSLNMIAFSFLMKKWWNNCFKILLQQSLKEHLKTIRRNKILSIYIIHAIIMGLFYIWSSEGRWALTLLDWFRWFVLCPFWSNPFDSVLAGDLFFTFWVSLGRQAQNLCGVTRGEFFSRLGFFPSAPIGRGLL